jgi:hypothetical protein
MYHVRKARRLSDENSDEKERSGKLVEAGIWYH